MPALACLALILRSNHAAISGTVFLRQWLRTLHLVAMCQRAAGINLLQRTPHSLSIRVESGDLDSEAMYAQIKQIASPLRNREATAPPWGPHACPAIQPQIQVHLKPGTQLFDPVEHLTD